jgi:hypothetical protein
MRQRYPTTPPPGPRDRGSPERPGLAQAGKAKALDGEATGGPLRAGALGAMRALKEEGDKREEGGAQPPLAVLCAPAPER